MNDSQVLAAVRRSLAQFSKVVSRLTVRVDALERSQRRVQSTAQKFWLFRAADTTGITYDPPEDRPAHGSTVWFDRDVENAIGGAYRPGGGAVRFGAPITETGEGDLVVDQDVLDDWDPTQPCLVVATVTVSGDFDPVAYLTPASISAAVSGTLDVVIDGNPATIEFTDPLALTSSDFAGGDGSPYMEPLPEGSLNIVPAEGFGIDHPYRAPQPLNITNGSSGRVATTVCVFGSGTPRVQCSLPIDDAAYPGDHTLTILTAVVPLVAVEQETP